MRRFLQIATGLVLALVVLLAIIVVQANRAIAREEIRSPADGAPGRMLNIAGHQWHVQTIGAATRDPTGVPILLVHGFIVAGGETFQPWATAQLPNRSLILPDLLGYGHSERLPVAGPWYGLRSYSDSLAAMLDQLHVKQVDLVGHSYGGTVVAQFALDHPDRVRRVIFIDPAIYVAPSAAEGIIQLPFGIGRAVAWHTLGGGPWSINALACRSGGCRWQDLAHVRNSTDTLRAMMRSHRQYGGPQALTDRLTRLRAPALIIWGEADRIIPVSDGQRLARDMRARLVVIHGAAHMPFLQAPDEVGSQVRQFLGSSR